MRILQIMNRVPWPLKDGGALGFFNYTKGYHQAGCEVTVCALNTNKHYIEKDELPSEVRQIADWRMTDINTDVKPLDAFLNLFTGKSYNIARFQSAEFSALLKKTLLEKSFDVVVFEGIFMAPYLHIVRKYSNSVCVLREHNVEYRIWETLAENARNPVKKLYLKLLASRMKKEELEWIRHFDGITTVTNHDAEEFRSKGATCPVFVSPFGIDMERLIPSENAPGKDSLFHLGSMEWLPNRHAMEWFLEKVWTPCATRFPEAVFYLAGRGMPDSFNAWSGAHVKVIGEVADAVAFMQEKQIMVVPLFAGSGIRVKILEGMALGKTIVSTPLGAQGIDVISGKQLLLATNETEFQEAIARLLTEVGLAEELGKEARKLAIERYDNTKVIAKVLSFYNELLNRK